MQHLDLRSALCRRSAPLLLALVALGGCRESFSGPEPLPDDYAYYDEACLVNADCGPGNSCRLGTCEAGCTSDDACDAGQVCNPRGQCVDDADFVLTEPIAVGQGASLSLELSAVEGSTATTQLTNTTDRRLRFRLVSDEPALVVSPEPQTVEAGESIEINAEIDTAALEFGRRVLTAQIVSGEGTINWSIEVPQPPIGHWRGVLTFAEEAPLGELDLGVNLSLSEDGSVEGQTFSDESLLFPRDAAITGTWDPDTRAVSMVIADVITADPIGADQTPPNPLRRDVGRRFVLDGKLDAAGTTVSGRMVESLYGLTDVVPEFEGQFSFRIDGGLREASPTVTDFGDEVFVLVPKWSWAPELDEGRCDDLGSRYGTVASTAGAVDANDPRVVACSACASSPLGCDDDDAAACGASLIEAGFNLPTETLNGDQLAPPAKTLWDTCISEADPVYDTNGTTCLDREAVRCAGALYRHALTTNGGSAYLEDALDQVAAESAMGAALGTEYLISSMFAYKDAGGNKVWLTEQDNLEKAQAALAGPLEAMFAPGFHQILTGLGPQKVLEERLGDDLGQMLDIGARFSDAWLAEMRLQQRVMPDEAELVRARVAWVATWAHLQGALMQSLADRYGADDRLFQVGQIAETIGILENLSQEVGREVNPFGFSPDYVPLKLATRDPMGELVRNYEIIRDDSNLAINFFKMELADAEAALEVFDQNEFNIVNQTASIEESYNQRLVSFCGSGANGGPDTDNCGQEAGDVREQVLRIELAANRLALAQLALENERKTIAILEDRIREEVANSADLEMNIDDLQQDIFKIQDMAGNEVSAIETAKVEAECSHLTKMAAFDAADIAAETAGNVAEAASDWPKGAAVAGVKAAEGAVKIGTAFGRAAVECGEIKKQAGYDSEIEDIQNAAAQEITLVNGEIDAAIRASMVQSKIDDIEVEVQKSVLRTLELAREVRSATIEVELASVELKTAINQVSSLINGRERSLRVLSQDPDNPFTNARFLRARLETGRGLQRWQNLALRAAYRTGRALEYELNRDIPLIEANLFPARSDGEIDEFMFCMDSVFQTYEEDFSSIGSQLIETDISLRDDVYGFTVPVVAGPIGEEASPAEQFAAVLTEPNRVNQAGNIELNFALPLLGETLFASNQCDDRVESIEVMFVGDDLGDQEIGVVLHRVGLSNLRRCDAANLSPTQAINSYQLDPESVGIQATANSFRDDEVGKSFGYAGYPISGDQLRVEIPSGDQDPRNADFDIRDVRDIVLRISHRAGTVSASGDGFNPVCG